MNWITGKTWRNAAAAALLLILTATFRFTGIDWDAYHHYHPDERFIAWVATTVEWPSDWSTALDPQQSTFNPFYWPPGAESAGVVVEQDTPRRFAYGHVPLYAGVAATRLAEYLAPSLVSRLPAGWKLTSDVLNGAARSEYDHIAVVGRVITALADLGTVLLVYILARRLFGSDVGLLAMALAAFSVLHIQLSHFYTVDPFLTLFVIAALTAMVYALPPPGDEVVGRKLRTGFAMLGAALIGLAVGAKFAGILLFLPLVTTIWLGGRAYFARRLTAGVLITVLVFFLTNPFAALDWTCSIVSPPFNLGPINLPAINWHNCYVENIARQNGMVQGISDLGFARQYIDTTPYLYFLEMLFRWGLGPAATIAGFAGLLWASFRGSVDVLGFWQRTRGLAARWYPAGTRFPISHGELVLLAWVLPYFLTTGRFFAKFLRYMQPITPFLFIFGAALILRWRSRLIRGLLSVPIVAVTALWALAFVAIYRAPHPWVEASLWIHENVPPPAQILSEQWDDALPTGMTIDGTYFPAYPYRSPELTWLTGPDGGDTVKKLGDNLTAMSNADYLVIASNRVYGVVPRLATRFPISSQYHQLLFDGELGFELAFIATRSPELFGHRFYADTFTWPGLEPPPAVADFFARSPGDALGRADESFIVYDQPLVMVWRNTERLTVQEMRARFDLPSSFPGR